MGDSWFEYTVKCHLFIALKGLARLLHFPKWRQDNFIALTSSVTSNGLEVNFLVLSDNTQGFEYIKRVVFLHYMRFQMDGSAILV